ncbi:AAA family ATPase [Oceaniserpentilla sp. 4NH20-0058]|uniref:diguanylate cyclase n=2 Tax=Oceaniserpentilla sp. 4NH20-0058 TaxID=3127660 RepID=UPI0031081AEA
MQLIPDEITIPGYEIESLICDRLSTRVYRARRLKDNLPVMLKCIGSDQQARESIASLKHEYEIARHLNASTVIRMHDLEYFNDFPVVVLEDFGGDSLANISKHHRFDLHEVLSIGIQLAKGLAEIHAANIIHKDINPTNIVYNPETGILKIIDFGISSSLTREQAAIANPHVFMLNLPYISPEQTGRMNRSIDYRSDFYSFGVTMFELITGELPFLVTEAIEWFHCHIAKRPKAPIQINPTIPQVVSDIIEKLMSKMAEHRYQSASGIAADLQKCLDQLDQTEQIEPFPLCINEIPQHFQIPQRLYGREREVIHLLDTFSRVRKGNNEIALVSGHSGIGKTCLVRELYKPITEYNGYFVSGKFDQLQRNIPYSAVINALQEMIKQLLSLNEEHLSQWRSKLLDVLGPNGQIIIELFSDVELIIGPQPPVTKLPLIETEQRFHLVFLNFIKVFCNPEHPLVIFLDDLQWADSASLNLIEILTNPDSKTKNLLIIGSYRNNEVFKGHPLLQCIENLANQNCTINEIQLQPLTLANITDLLSDALYSDASQVQQLAQLLEQKTAGNPFFAEEFLKALNKENLITYSKDKHQWQWDINQIQAQKMTDNVVDLMTEKLRQLPPTSLHLMELAACIGNRFKLNDLAVVSEQVNDSIAKNLRYAMGEGVIAPIGDAYQLLELDDNQNDELSIEFAFAHDRIQQAAYSLLDDKNKEQTHLKIGRLLLINASESQQKEKLFDITNHLNLGVHFIEDAIEKDRLCLLNLKAGQRAKASSAYQAAFAYLQAALQLLPTTCWQDKYSLTLKLHEEAAETAFLNADYDSMEAFLETGFTKAKCLLDKIELYLVKTSALIAQGKLAEAVTLVKPIMKQLGHKYPEKPNKLHVAFELIKNLVVLKNVKPESLQHHPEMTDPYHIAAHKLGDRAGSAVLFTQPDMLSMMALRAARIQYKHGICPDSLPSWAVYGMVLSSQLNKTKLGFEYGQLSITLSQRFQNMPMLARSMHVFNAMVRHWHEPAKNTLEPLLDTFRIAMDNGEFEYAALAIEIRLFTMFDLGYNLSMLAEEMTEWQDTLKPLKLGYGLDYLLNLQQAVANLQGQAEDPLVMVGDIYDIIEKRKLHEEIGDNTLISTDHEMSLWVRFLMGDRKNALKQANLFPIEKSLVAGFQKTSRCYMLDALIRLTNIKYANKKEKRQLLKQAKKTQAKIKSWADHNPTNFLHKYLLVEAQRLRVNGHDFEAHEQFDAAIESCTDNDFLQYQALANELCGEMHWEKGRKTIALPYLAQARTLYAKWGAMAKVKQLEQLFPQLTSFIKRTEVTPPTSPDETHTKHIDNVDITALMKALKTIADEKVHSRMLQAIIASSVEFAAAQRGILILRNAEGDFRIEGEISVEGSNPKVLQSLLVEKAKLSHTLLNYVQRTGNSLVVHDAQLPFEDLPGLHLDDYIQQNKVRSILCLPIMSGCDENIELIGLLYLENNLTSDCFTQARFDTLEIIVMAAAGRLELSRKASFDGLTGLFNHEYFQNSLKQEFAASRRAKNNLGLLLIDIDHFKKFNDTWGHQIGDLVLREVSKVIKDCSRSSDLVARYGGEEMVVVLPNTNRSGAMEIAERIRSSIANHSVAHNGEELKVTISLGVALITPDVQDKDELIRQADAALYRAKHNGRNQVQIWD